MNNTESSAFPEKRDFMLVSRDEMNLAEFPLTVLSTRTNPQLKTLEFSDTVKSRKGDLLRRHWIVTGADKFGLPTASDDEVLLGLLKLSVNSGFRERKIFFTRYELLKTLRWTTEGRSYQRLQNAFDRLSGVRIKATNAFFDNDSKAHSTRNFGIIDAYEINHAGGEGESKPSFFVWSEVLFKSFQAGYIKKLDLDFYLNLKSSISKRLYRYLDKHFWYRSKFQVNLFVLAHEKLGISRNYRFASSIRQQLDPALQELQACGFLSHHEYYNKGSATEIGLFAKIKAPRAIAKKSFSAQQSNLPFEETTLPTNPLFTQIFEQLVLRGIKDNQAQKLLSAKSDAELERISKIVKHYDNLLAQGSHLVSKSPVGFLYRAVQHPQRFVLPGDMQQQSGKNEAQRSEAVSMKPGLNGQNAKDQMQQSRAFSKPDKLEALESRYLIERKLAAQRFSTEIEPGMLAKINREVEQALAKLKGLISELRFSEALKHGVEKQLLKLFAFPEFDEWLERQ